MQLTYLIALAITLAIEVPVVAAFFPGQRGRMAAACAAATTVTHLTMHFVLPGLTSSFGQFILVGEVGALAVEAGVYWLVSQPREPGRALAASAVANLLSYGAGLLYFRWI